MNSFVEKHEVMQRKAKQDKKTKKGGRVHIIPFQFLFFFSFPQQQNQTFT